MATIDADAHVLETPITWEHMDPEHKKFAPMVVNSSDIAAHVCVACIGDEVTDTLLE